MPTPDAPLRRVLAPREWWAHLLALALVAGAGLLGWWQLEAWQERRAAEAVDLTELDPVPLAGVLGPDEAFPEGALGRPVTIRGTWRPADTTWVAAPTGGDASSWVVTPLTVAGTGSVLPVVRGSLPDDATRPAEPAGEVTLVARLQPADAVVRVAELAQDVDADLYSGYAVAEPGQPGTGGLDAADLEQLPAPSRFTALRNLLYAIEWWVFGLFAAFIWWRHVRDVAGQPPDEPSGPGEPGEPGQPGQPGQPGERTEPGDRPAGDHAVPSEP